MSEQCSEKRAQRDKRQARDAQDPHEDRHDLCGEGCDGERLCLRKASAQRRLSAKPPIDAVRKWQRAPARCLVQPHALRPAHRFPPDYAAPARKQGVMRHSARHCTELSTDFVDKLTGRISRGSLRFLREAASPCATHRLRATLRHGVQGHHERLGAADVPRISRRDQVTRRQGLAPLHASAMAHARSLAGLRRLPRQRDQAMPSSACHISLSRCAVQMRGSAYCVASSYARVTSKGMQ